MSSLSSLFAYVANNMYRNYKMALARMRRICEDIPEELRGTVILVFICGSIIVHCTLYVSSDCPAYKLQLTRRQLRHSHWSQNLPDCLVPRYSDRRAKWLLGRALRPSLVSTILHVNSSCARRCFLQRGALVTRQPQNDNLCVRV